MELDIIVYKNIKKSTEEDGDFYACVGREEWLYKIKNLQNEVWYSGNRQDVGVSYSYKSHLNFRKELLKITGNKHAITKNGEIDWILVVAENVPFKELIDFSDWQGCLDFETAEKLYQDFNEYKGKLIEINTYYHDYYLDWLNVFKAAKDFGVVVFC